ncbi:uncharacterized protein LY89DRAFT_684216 [Mollisia scopiformis]|uniref:Uncharacterized protein n=1 Tax=Mollisia scopiformis TaxID=149040 RepID=A0A194XDR5_MOLSC|nr:uncharacterized protein LY89DRAFT_684216 [Mollisia scopiformis]KUJ18294.1 hypothetical protein LY89DRAFT_684216 [Mollisia scopiformis]
MLEASEASEDVMLEATEANEEVTDGASDVTDEAWDSIEESAEETTDSIEDKAEVGAADSLDSMEGRTVMGDTTGVLLNDSVGIPSEGPTAAVPVERAAGVVRAEIEGTSVVEAVTMTVVRMGRTAEYESRASAITAAARCSKPDSMAETPVAVAVMAAYSLERLDSRAAKLICAFVYMSG